MCKYNFDFHCFRNLRNEMYEVQYNMYPFEFCFNRVDTFVAAYIITNDERQENVSLKYVLFRLIFMKQDDLDDVLECYINANGIVEYQRQALMTFFNINYNSCAKEDFMDLFCTMLSNVCPLHATIIQREDLLHVEIHSLCRQLNLDPAHCYRRGIIRLGKDANGKQKHRDPNTYQLALIKFPHAAKQYESETTITYSFTGEENEEVEEAVAIHRFIENEKRRKKQ